MILKFKFLVNFFFWSEKKIGPPAQTGSLSAAVIENTMCVVMTIFANIDFGACHGNLYCARQRKNK